MTKPQTAEVTKKVADTDKADSPRREPIRRFESGTTSVDEDSDNESSISFNGGDSKKSKAMYPGVVREKKKFKSSNKQLGIPVRFSVCAHPPSFAVEYRADAQAPLFRSRTIFHNALVGVFFSIFHCFLNVSFSLRASNSQSSRRYFLKENLYHAPLSMFFAGTRKIVQKVQKESGASFATWELLAATGC